MNWAQVRNLGSTHHGRLIYTQVAGIALSMRNFQSCFAQKILTEKLLIDKHYLVTSQNCVLLLQGGLGLRIENQQTLNHPWKNFCWNIFWRTFFLFVGLLMPLLWTSGNVCPGFQSQGVSLTYVLCCLCAMESPDLRLVQHLLTSR